MSSSRGLGSRYVPKHENKSISKWILEWDAVNVAKKVFEKEFFFLIHHVNMKRWMCFILKIILWKIIE